MDAWVEVSQKELLGTMVRLGFLNFQVVFWVKS